MGRECQGMYVCMYVYIHFENFIRTPCKLIHVYVHLQKYEEEMGYLVGDCLVGAAFLSYAGPFLSDYRDELVQDTWLKQVCTYTTKAHAPCFVLSYLATDSTDCFLSRFES